MLIIAYILIITFNFYIIYSYYSRKDQILYHILFYFSIGTAIWLVCDTMFFIVSSENLMIFFNEFKFIAVLFLPLLFFDFLHAYHNDKALSRRQFAALSIFPIITLIVIATNPFHHLFRESIYVTYNRINFVQSINGPWYYLHTVYSYGIILIALFFHINHYLKNPPIYRLRSFIILLGSLFPFLANIIYQITVFKYNFIYDFTPISFFTTTVLYYYALFFYKPVRLNLLARDLMINNMRNATVFLDRSNKVFNVNQQFNILCNELGDVMNQSIYDYDSSLFNAIKEIINAPDSEVFYSAKIENNTLYYSLNFTKVIDPLDNAVGSLIVFNDITEINNVMSELEYSNIHDSLTGLYNRNYFEKKVIELDKAENYPLSIISIDINGLKNINNNHNYAVGNRVLQDVAELLRHNICNNAHIFRLGGDEFIILVTSEAEDCIYHMINQIEKDCSKITVSNYALTLSFGVSIKSHLHDDLHAVLRRADRNMYRNKLLTGTSSRDNNLLLLTKILLGKNVETATHLYRTSILSESFAKKLRLSISEVKDLILVSQLHDIGKTVIPDSILFKPGKLNDEEWGIMKTHTTRGYEILEASPTLDSIASTVLYHHERWDGNGYPHNLKGEEIPLLARIISIIDAYDVITSKRCYKEAQSSKEALIELERCEGTQFDPNLCRLFIEMIKEDQGSN